MEKEVKENEEKRIVASCVKKFKESGRTEIRQAKAK